VVDSSCFLVSAKPSCYPVFGLFWTQIGPTFQVKVCPSSSPFNGRCFARNDDAKPVGDLGSAVLFTVSITPSSSG
jgi:hypothetical protein